MLLGVFLLAQALPTSLPSPSVSSTPCRAPDKEAGLLTLGDDNYPDDVRRYGYGAVSIPVVVTVGPDGKPLKILIAKSSGVLALDRAAITQARTSQFSPKIVSCKPVTAEYLFWTKLEP